MRHLPSLIALRFFEETARHLSFNRAARALCVTQGAVSRQIRLLEESLGVKLFERDHRGIRLTQAGVSLMPSVKEAFNVIERGTRHLTGTVERKRLIVSLPPTFATQWFSSRFGALSEQLPDVDLSFARRKRRMSLQRALWARPVAQGWSELLIVERHALVGSASLKGTPVETLLDRLPALHVLHEDVRLNLWPDWLAKAGLPPRYAENGIEFSNLHRQSMRRDVALGLPLWI